MATSTLIFFKCNALSLIHYDTGVRCGFVYKLGRSGLKFWLILGNQLVVDCKIVDTTRNLTGNRPNDVASYSTVLT